MLRPPKRCVEAHEITTPDDETVRALTVRHKGRGLFAVFGVEDQLTSDARPSRGAPCIEHRPTIWQSQGR